MSRTHRRCRFCNAYIGMYHKSDYCDEHCRKPKQPKIKGVFWQAAFGACAICGDTTDSEMFVSPGTKVGADWRSHGIWLHGWCEKEWLERHAYNERKPFPYEKLGDFGKPERDNKPLLMRSLAQEP